MGALTTLAVRSVAKLAEEEIIRRVVLALAEAAPPFPAAIAPTCPSQVAGPSVQAPSTR